MISVIIPLYNVEKYIEYCFKSFENQMYKDFELVVINDGSTDNSVELVKEYMSKSRMRIRLIEQENAGVSVARNKGIENANGQYICFVDSDDMVTPEYLNTLFHAINKEEEYDMAVCTIKNVTDDAVDNEINYEKKILKVMSSYEALDKFLLRSFKPGVYSLLVRTEFLRNNNLYFSEGYRYSEDIELIFKMIAHSRSIVYTEEPLYLYRQRNNSVMSIVDDKRLDGFELMINLEPFFHEVAPNFAERFRKYGVARWVWATTWQAAIGTNNFKEFSILVKKIQANKYLKKLISFPDLRVKLSSVVYLLTPRLYYYIVKNIIGKTNNIRSMTNGIK